MDEESFRKELYHSFAAKGIPDALKLHMRNSLLKNLHNVSSKRGKRGSESLLTEEDLGQKISDKLVYRHLQRSNYNYTLSLFAPEAKLSTSDLSSSLEDILQLLNVSPGSVAFNRIKQVVHDEKSAESGSDLWIVVKTLLKCFGADEGGDHKTRSLAVQTGSSVFDKSSPLSFSDKMRAIDEEYEERERENEMSLAEKLNLMRREMESRYEEQLNAELKRIREMEVTKVRLDLEQKFRNESAAVKAQLEAKYEERLMALQRREDASLESTRTKMQTIEKESYAKRQFLLEQIESLRKREIAISRQSDMQQRNLSLMESKVKESERALCAREKAVQQLESNYETRLVQGEMRMREEVKNEYATRMATLKQQETELDQQKKAIEASADKLRRLGEIEYSMERMKVDMASMQRQNDFNEERLQEMSDYHKVRQENIMLLEEIQTLKRNFDDVLEVSNRINTDRHMTSRALSEQGPSLLGSARRNAGASSSRLVPPLNFDRADTQRQTVPQDAHISAVIRQMATELARLKLQIANQQSSHTSINPQLTTSHEGNVVTDAASNVHVAPNVDNLHNDSAVAPDELPDISTSSGGDEDFVNVHRTLGHLGGTSIYKKQNEAMSFGGLQFLSESRSKMQNLSQEADHLETRYKSYSQRLSMLAEETYKISTSSSSSPRQDMAAVQGNSRYLTEKKSVDDMSYFQLHATKATADETDGRAVKTSVHRSSYLSPVADISVVSSIPNQVSFLQSPSKQKSSSDLNVDEAVDTSIVAASFIPTSKSSGQPSACWTPVKKSSNIVAPSPTSNALTDAFKQKLHSVSSHDLNDSNLREMEEQKGDVGTLKKPEFSVETGTAANWDVKDFDADQKPPSPFPKMSTATKLSPRKEEASDVEDEEVDEYLEEISDDDFEDDEDKSEPMNVNKNVSEVEFEKEELEQSDRGDPSVHAAGDVFTGQQKDLAFRGSEWPEAQQTTGAEATEPKRASFKNLFAYSDVFSDDEKNAKEKKEHDFFSDRDDNEDEKGEPEKYDDIDEEFI